MFPIGLCRVERGERVAVSDGFDESEVPRGGRGEDDDDTPTPVVARRLMRCLPCLGTGRLRLLGVELYETRRPCPYCRGAGTRIVLLRAEREVSSRDGMTFAELGRCQGSFRPGRRAPFGRVVCSVCGARFRPMSG